MQIFFFFTLNKKNININNFKHKIINILKINLFILLSNYIVTYLFYYKLLTNKNINKIKIRLVN